jgi:hypothetical protein
MKLYNSLFIAFSLLSVAAAANAQDVAGEVSVNKAQFTDKVESSKPSGDADLTHARSVTYWLEVKNTKAPTHVTLVWKLDGHEIVRQSLDVGISPAWKTWGSAGVRGAKTVEVDVLDESGNTIKTDTINAV